MTIVQARRRRRLLLHSEWRVNLTTPLRNFRSTREELEYRRRNSLAYVFSFQVLPPLEKFDVSALPLAELECAICRWLPGDEFRSGDCPAHAGS